jgi:ABC-type sugar transport system ATPase subunit
MTALRLEGISKIFPGGQEAVAGVDLEVSRKEMVVLLGPSGCGKSTLLRIVAGIETPTKGRVLIDGVDVTEVPPQKRDVAMVFQSYALYPHMKVRENLAFGLRMRGFGTEETARRVDEVARTLGIESLLDRRPAQLSGGQRQRVALGRAIARQAKVFLLDEPLSNLDAQLRVRTRAELARLHRTLEAPMIYVTHDQEEAMTLGDRVVVMRGGKVLQIDSPMEVYLRPATGFVAGFVGSPRMNFLPGRVAPIGNGILPVDGLERGMGVLLDVTGVDPVEAAARAGGAGPAADAAKRSPTGGRPVLVGIRPEDITIADPAGADLVARADVVESLGREFLLHFVIGGEGLDDLTDLRVLSNSAGTIAPGSLVGMTLNRKRIHLFDPETDRRIV